MSLCKSYRSQPFTYAFLSDRDEEHWPSASRFKPPSWILKAILLSIVVIMSAFAGAIIGPRTIVSLVPGYYNNRAFSNPNVPLGVVYESFTYNRTFGADPKNDSKSQLYWDSIIPLGQGTVQYPSGSLKFATISAVHQLHCLWSIHRNFFKALHVEVSRGEEEETLPHMRHCFDYLRQGIMCASDTTLEPVDLDLGGVTGWRTQRQCRDYRELVQWAEKRRASNMRGLEEAHKSH